MNYYYRKLNYKACLVFLILILSTASFYAQQRQCLHDSKSLVLEITDINFSIQFRHPVFIPVVVHIVSFKEQEISDLQIRAQIAALNRDFRKRGNEWKQLPRYARMLATDTQIEFFLATIDPKGNPTSGITRKTTSIKNIALHDNIYHEEQGGANAWNTNHYLNIWVGEMPEGLLGYSSSPEETGSASDGVVINIDYFGTSNATPPYQMGRTLVHEVGHYLGLEHPWGNIKEECIEDDGLDDTPILKNPHYTCPPMENQSCEDTDFYWNFMDYTPDCCMALFTPQQAQLMHLVLDQYRSELVVNEINDPSVSINGTKLIPNPAGYSTLIHWDKEGLNAIQIYTLHGALIDTLLPCEKEKHLSICLNEYPSGILLFIFHYRDNTTHIKKLIHI
ncbi:MAG: hypothetical protein MI974_27460 [Chitinophagales bacterium]|nr:hypothetical protein [Chitinophagales bacterium]